MVSPLAIRPGERHRQHVQRGELHLLRVDRVTTVRKSFAACTECVSSAALTGTDIGR